MRKVLELGYVMRRLRKELNEIYDRQRQSQKYWSI